MIANLLDSIQLIPTDVAQSAQGILTMRDMTIGGILLAFCVYMGYKVHQLEKKIVHLENTNKRLWETYVADVKTHAEDYRAEAAKFHTTVEQLKSLVNVLHEVIAVTRG